MTHDTTTATAQRTVPPAGWRGPADASLWQRLEAHTNDAILGRLYHDAATDVAQCGHIHGDVVAMILLADACAAYSSARATLQNAERTNYCLGRAQHRLDVAWSRLLLVRSLLARRDYGTMTTDTHYDDDE